MDTEELQVSDGWPTRAEIADSWRRVMMCGLGPSDDPEHDLIEINPDAKLARSAGPVLAKLKDDLADQRIALMLIDGTATLVDTVTGTKDLDPALERIGGVRGATWTEERTGTNALSTVFETRMPLLVRGDDHFMESMKDFTCFGAPIINPRTGRLEGVLDIVGDRDLDTRLMKPLVNRAIDEIRRLLVMDDSSGSDQLFAEFKNSVLNPALTGVIAVGDDLVFLDARAAALLSAADVGMLSALAEDATGRQRTVEIALSLESRVDIVAEMAPVGDAPRSGAVIGVRTQNSVSVPRTAPRRSLFRELVQLPERLSRTDRTTVVVGGPGSGKSTLLRDIAASRSARLIDVARENEESVIAAIHEAGGAPDGSLLLIDDGELLSVRAKSLLSNLLQAWPSRAIVVTWDECAAKSDGAVVTRFVDQIDLRPLRSMRDEIPAIVRAMCGTARPPTFDALAMRVMVEHDWPGNLAELRSTLDFVSGLPAQSVVGIDQLPHRLGRVSTKRLTPWQRAARDAIADALTQTNQNKSHAASLLGISRNTLYHHMREYGM